MIDAPETVPTLSTTSSQDKERLTPMRTFCTTSMLILSVLLCKGNIIAQDVNQNDNPAQLQLLPPVFQDDLPDAPLWEPSNNNGVEFLPPPPVNDSPYYPVDPFLGQDKLVPIPQEYAEERSATEGETCPVMPIELSNILKERWERLTQGAVPYPLEPGETMPTYSQWVETQTEFQNWKKTWDADGDGFQDEVWEIRIQPRNAPARIERVPLNQKFEPVPAGRLPIIRPRNVKPEPADPLPAPRPQPRLRKVA